MNQVATTPARSSIWVPVTGLSIFAIASGYLMSLLPLALGHNNLPTQAASWLASAYYIGLLIGSLMIEPVIKRIGHRMAFVTFLTLLAATVLLMSVNGDLNLWLGSRFIAGIAVAGIFVVIESWLLIGDSKEERAKNLGLYMTSLYGGTTLGQFGIGIFGTAGMIPFAVVLGLLLAAMLPAIAAKGAKPNVEQHISLSLRQILGLSKPAFVGCIVSGIVMGSIYGLLPLALKAEVSGNDKISVLMAATVLGGMVIQPIVGKLSCRMSKTVLLALMCLLGVFAMGLYLVDQSYVTQIVALALLGMSAFALYPIAITLACDGIPSQSIVSATQVMLFCYSVGSALGPVAADFYMGQEQGLMAYFFGILLATSLYMLLVSLKTKPAAVAH
ncbi:MFS transporter [Photobacterium aquae]|uniref:MFS transporter n=1 Tax=Photobacterium aquae TaxID=1195763 RepID=A0A0J1GXG5_9GAMM|nr:MFS transporter [Photobacterium aquae]KLV04144.1 MFS transporter [Photobacterium aquae]